MQKTLKQLQGESNKRDAKLYANMFAPMRNDSAVATKVSCAIVFDQSSQFKLMTIVKPLLQTRNVKVYNLHN